MVTWAFFSAVAISLGFSAPADYFAKGEALASIQKSPDQFVEVDHGARMLVFAKARPSRWSSLLAKHQEQIAANGEAWRRLTAQFAGLSGEALLGRVNKVVNAATYVPDAQNWGVADYWETPLDLFSRGGDCEDFAIAKYLVLREVGVDPKSMRVAVSKDHAVLIVDTPRGAVVLDNRSTDVRRLTDRDMAKTRFTVSDLRWEVNLS
jgi:predicted transglutaminase-like cysteine proteinase